MDALGAPGSSPTARIAIDVKVINALGAGHITATCGETLGAAEAYHDKALNHQQTAARCAVQGITYAPAVFTVQGGIAKKAEAIMHQIAEKIAMREHRSEPEVFQEMVERVSATLARHGAKATLRRSSGRVACRPAGSNEWSESLWRAACRDSAEAGAEGPDDEDAECAEGVHEAASTDAAQQWQ